MIVIGIQWIRLRRDRVNQLSLDEQRCVFNNMFKKDSFGHAIGGHNVQTNLTGMAHFIRCSKARSHPHLSSFSEICSSFMPYLRTELISMPCLIRNERISSRRLSFVRSMRERFPWPRSVNHLRFDFHLLAKGGVDCRLLPLILQHLLIGPHGDISKQVLSARRFAN